MAYIQCIVGVIPPVRVLGQRGSIRALHQGRHTTETSITSAGSLLPGHAAPFGTPSSESIPLAGGVAVFLGAFLAATASGIPVLPFYFFHEGSGRGIWLTPSKEANEPSSVFGSDRSQTKHIVRVRYVSGNAKEEYEAT